MPPLNLDVTVWGRPVKPVALFLTLSALVVAAINVLDVGILQTSAWGDLVGVVMAGAASLLVVGWVTRSQRIAEVGLIAAFMAWLFRFWIGGLVTGFQLAHEGVWLSLCWAGIAGGSWALERLDPRAT